MQQQPSAEDPVRHDAGPAAYPHGRGYGHDYMRGGEVLGGYGYSARAEYERRRGDDGGGVGGGTGRPDVGDAVS